MQKSVKLRRSTHRHRDTGGRAERRRSSRRIRASVALRPDTDMSEVQLRYEELQTTLQGLRSRVDGLDANKSAAGREQVSVDEAADDER